MDKNEIELIKKNLRQMSIKLGYVSDSYVVKLSEAIDMLNSFKSNNRRKIKTDTKEQIEETIKKNDEEIRKDNKVLKS